MEFRSRWSLPMGMLVVVLSAMMLNGFIGYVIWPEECHQDSFIGSVSHLLLGLVPFLGGIALMAASSVSPRTMVKATAGGLAGGVLMGGFITTVCVREPDLKAAALWLAITVFGFLAGILARVLVVRGRGSPA